MTNYLSTKAKLQISKYHYFGILLIFLLVDSARGFVIRNGKHFTRGSSSSESPAASVSSISLSSVVSTTSGDQNAAEDIDELILLKFRELHPSNNGNIEKIQLLTFTLENFKPLGCTVEESFVVDQDGSKAVFVSNVIQGGNAQKIGIKTADVIAAVSGNFRDDIVEVIGASLEKVKGLITGRSEEDGLVIKVIRGSDVMTKHESALVDLCTVPAVDKDVDKCIEILYKADYEMREDITMSSGNTDCATDDDAECMLDQLFDVWGEEMGLQKANDNSSPSVDETKKKPAPWSSRSSPSGTFVRDPTTGKLVNIDE